MKKENLKNIVKNFIEQYQVFYKEQLTEAFVLCALDKYIKKTKPEKLGEELNLSIARTINSLCEIEDDKLTMKKQFNYENLNNFFPKKFTLDENNNPIITNKMYIKEENFGTMEKMMIENTKEKIISIGKTKKLYDNIIIPGMEDFTFQVYYRFGTVGEIVILDNKENKIVGGVSAGTSYVEEEYRKMGLGKSLIVVNYYSNLFSDNFGPTHFSENGFFARLNGFNKIKEMERNGEKLIILENKDLDYFYEEVVDSFEDKKNNPEKYVMKNKNYFFST